MHQHNAASVALRGGLRFLRLAEFFRYNRAAIGGPSKRQPMNSLVSSCLGSTCYVQTPFARYWRAIKAAANELTGIKLSRLNLVIVQTPKSITLMYKNKFRKKINTQPPEYSTSMTAKLGTTHSNIQTAQSSLTLVESKPTMH